ncbi:MAG: LacI family DNA-binding transcriptional regulator [Microlunatus sp.]|nr:LacI family DNA-binding transcriptional regulator [Microlunatus sp.]
MKDTDNGAGSGPQPTPPAHNATLSDVAREAGVSLATASRSLNGSSRTVREEYRQRVLAAARRLNYSANSSAQAVARGTSQTVALIVSDIADPYFSSIASGVMRSAEEQGLVVTMSITERRPEREAELVRALRGMRPRSLILVGSRRADPKASGELEAELTAYEASGGRVTMIAQPTMPFRTVEIRNQEAAADLAEQLVGLGYRSMAVLGGPQALFTARDRVRGFVDRCRELGVQIPERRIVHGDFTRDGGFVAAAELHRRELSDTELVFAANDVMAVGAMAYFRTAGLQLGRDIAIAGFDDIETLRDVSPALTTVALPLQEIGSAAVSLAMAENPRHRVVPIAGSVIIRESTPRRS